MGEIMENTKGGGQMEQEISLTPTISKKEDMEQMLTSDMKTNDSERMQPKGCVKTNEKLKLIQKYHDEEKTKLWQQYHVDQFDQIQGEYKKWRVNRQIAVIGNRKDGKVHGKYQKWWSDGIRWYIDTNHFKKGMHGTEIEFHHKKPNLFSQLLKYMNGINQIIVYTYELKYKTYENNNLRNNSKSK